ncbi:MAG: N-acetylmuramoyl-L-alanine amidase [Ignavibacteriaceae bacterium]|nr:N-acetylmuramoyl-L-alanine amidase [Ignavibacteriaceae bacterium]
MKYPVILLLSGLFLIGCSADITYYEIPIEFKNPQKKKELLTNYTKYLFGKKIFLDPGHGGEDRRNQGPKGLTIEADANLNVALALRDFLNEAGVQVIMSRSEDMTVDLKARSIMADSSGAELFISIHHNAPGKGGDEGINYTSTYYHALETDFEYEPCERDIAKYIQRDLSYAMRNSGGLGSFDGTYSDYMIYPGAGFSVLRLTKIPSVLVECGFFTNPHEERRLAIDEFNKIQAWGIFRGIARYYAAGIPQIKFLTAEDIFDKTEINLEFSISDSVQINAKSIQVYVDSISVNNYKFEALTNILSINLADLEEGEHIVRIIAANGNGNHSFPFNQKIIVKENTKNHF